MSGDRLHPAGLFRTLLAHWRRHPVQLACLLVGLALATALWTGVRAINDEARASYARAASQLAGADRDQIVSRGGDSFDQGAYGALRQAGWPVSPVVEGRITRAGQTLRIVGIDPVTAPPGAMGTTPAEGGATGDGGAGGDLLAFITPPGRGFGAPDTVAALAGAPDLPALSVGADMPPRVLLMDVGIAQRLLDRPGRLTRLVLTGPVPAGVSRLDALAPDLVRQAGQNANDLGQLTDSFHLSLSAFAVLAFLVGFFIVQAMVALAMEQRRPVFFTLRALGVPLWALIGALCLEAVALALIAGAIGVALGYGLAGALIGDVAATLRGLYGADLDGGLRLRGATMAGALGLALFGALAATGHGLVRLARRPLGAPQRPRAWARGSWRLTALQAAASALCIAAAGALALWGQGLMAGFALLGAILLAAILALGPVLALGLAGAERLARRARARWFWADTAQQLPGLRMALMALMLALAANLGVGTMVGSFRAAFLTWLDQRLSADLYIQPRDLAEAGAITTHLRARGLDVLPLWRAELTLPGGPVQVRGYDDHPRQRAGWPLLRASPGPDPWAGVFAGTHAMISEQLSHRRAIGLGERITLAPGRGVTVAAIYADYGNPRGEIVISASLLRALAPDARLSGLGAYWPGGEPGAQIGASVADLGESLGLPAGNITDQGALKAFSRDVFETTFAVTGALNLLTLIVAAVALLTSLMTLSGMRFQQLAPVWALGETRLRLAGFEVARALTLGGFVFLAALPAGLALAWALLAVVNVEAFGWRLPMRVFPADWARLGLLALAASAAASAWPAWRLARGSPGRLIGVFSNEN